MYINENAEINEQPNDVKAESPKIDPLFSKSISTLSKSIKVIHFSVRTGPKVFLFL